MDSAAYNGINFSYVIDADYRFVSISEGMSQLYPHLTLGSICHKSIFDLDTPCTTCPLNEPKNTELSVYNPVSKCWVNCICVDIDWPGSGPCTLLACSQVKEINSSIMKRIPYMAGYDVFFEMNLTQNKFRRFFHGNEAEFSKYEDESLDSLMARTCEQIVHPLDQERFNTFWDFSTMIERLNNSHGTIHDEFLERNARGTWDLVHTTIVPETTFGSREDVIVAMYSIIKSPQLAQIALSTEGISHHEMHETPSESALRRLVSAEDFEVLLAQQMKDANLATLCVAYFDIENFRFFNRWFGRKTGDQLLEDFASYLLELEENFNAIPCRISDDKFAFSMPFSMNLMNEAFSHLKEIIQASCSNAGFRIAFGAYLIDENIDVIDVVDRARTASKRSLENYDEVTWYDEDHASKQEKYLRALAEINTALSKEQFVIYFQPKVNIETNEIVGAEALARWEHPTKGILNPATFIPTLEQSGEITKLDLQIWTTTFKTIRDWLDEGISLPPVSINVSRYDIDKIDVVQEMVNLSNKFNVDSRYIEIEFTETAFSENTEKVKQVIADLHTYGFTVSIDDFGSGYSSLNMLKDISADILKLDLKFLDFTENNSSRAVSIIRSIIEMAHNLNIPIVVEGVETQEQVAVLRELECVYVQGYLYYKPINCNTFKDALKAQPVYAQGICYQFLEANKDRKIIHRSQFETSMLNTMKTPIVLYGLTGSSIDILQYNEEFAKAVGIHELVRRQTSIQDFIRQSDLPAVYKALKDAEANPSQIVPCTMYVFKENGDRVLFPVDLAYVGKEGKRKLFFGLPHLAPEANSTQ